MLVGNTETLFSYRPNDFFNEKSLLKTEPSQYSVKVAEDARIYTLDRGILQRMIKGWRGAGRHFSRKFSKASKLSRGD